MKTEKLTPVQIMTMTCAAVVGVDTLVVARQMVSLAGRDGWIALFLGGVLALISGAIIYYLAILYPDKDLPQIFIHIGGKVIGRILVIPVLIYTLLYLAFSMRIFSHAISVFIMDRTPIYAIVTLMTLITAYAVYQGIYVMGGIIDILFPIGKLTIFLLIFLSFSIAEPSHLKPILFENTAEVVKAIISGYQQFTGIGVIAYIFCYTQKSKGRFKWYMAGITIGIILYVSLTIASIMVFSAPGILSLIFPTLTLSKSIEFPATFLERLESFTAVLWISITFESMIIFYFASVRNFIAFLGLKQKHHKYVVYAHIPLVIALALAIQLARKVLEYFEMIKQIETSVGLVIIPILLIYTLFVRKRRKTNETGY